jgi:HEAT repeat protein
MTALAAFRYSGLAIGLLCLALACAVVLRRWLRQRSGRRTRALTEPYRRHLVAMVAEGAQGDRQVLLDLEPRTWQALEPAVVAMVRKVRGESRHSLVDLLARRGTVDRYTRALRSLSPVRRARSAELLGLLGELAPRADLERVLAEDWDPEVRIVAARALGEAGDAQAAGALLAASHGPHAVPLRIVARSLARLGPSIAPALIEALTWPEPAARAVSVEILGLLGVVAAAPALSRAALYDADQDVRIRAARALGRVGTPASLAVLDRCIDSGQPVALRAVAARAIGDVGGRSAVNVLAPLLADPIHRVAVNAADALARLGPPGRAELVRAAVGPGPGAGYAAEALAMRALSGAATADVGPAPAAPAPVAPAPAGSGSTNAPAVPVR